MYDGPYLGLRNVHHAHTDVRASLSNHSHGRPTDVSSTHAAYVVLKLVRSHGLSRTGETRTYVGYTVVHGWDKGGPRVGQGWSNTQVAKFVLSEQNRRPLEQILSSYQSVPTVAFVGRGKS